MTISKLAQVLNGLIQNVDLSAKQLILGSFKLGGAEGTALDKTALDSLISNSHAAQSDNQTITAGNGLTGGGSGASVTLDVGAGNGIEVAADTVSVKLDGSTLSVSGSGLKVTDDTFLGKLDKAADSDKLNGQSASFYATSSELSSLEAIIQNFEWQPSVLDRLASPPAEPASGDRYLIIAEATGAWEGKEHQIAEWDGEAWVFTVTTVGTYVSVDDEADGLYLFGGAVWVKKYFEATTASTGLTKDGFDIQLADAVAADGIVVSSGAISAVVDDSSIEINVSEQLQVKADGIKDSHIDWGTGENQVSAADMPIADAGEVFTATDVEGALDELEGRISSVETGASSIIKSMVVGQSFSANTTYAVRYAISGETAGRIYVVDPSNTAKSHIIGLIRPSELKEAGASVDVLLLGEILSSVDFTAAQDEGKPVYANASGVPTVTPPSEGAVVYMGSVSAVGEGVSKILVQAPRLVGVN